MEFLVGFAFGVVIGAAYAVTNTSAVKSLESKVLAELAALKAKL